MNCPNCNMALAAATEKQWYSKLQHLRSGSFPERLRDLLP